MLLVHALGNAAVPIVTVIGLGVALLIGGVVVTESVFNIPGLGRLIVDAILKRDYPIIQGLILFFSFLYIAAQPADRHRLHAARSEDPLLSDGRRPRSAVGATDVRRLAPARRALSARRGERGHHRC